MSLLRVALRLRRNICVHYASRWTRMVWGGLPGIVQQFHPAQFLENNTTPILRRPDRPQSALAFAAILIAEHARLAQAIAAQPVRAKQPRQIFIDGPDRSLIRYRRPNQPIHLLHGLNLRLNDTHPNFTIPLVALSLCPSAIYNTVVLVGSEPTPKPNPMTVGTLYTPPQRRGNRFIPECRYASRIHTCRVALLPLFGILAPQPLRSPRSAIAAAGQPCGAPLQGADARRESARLRIRVRRAGVHVLERHRPGGHRDRLDLVILPDAPRPLLG